MSRLSFKNFASLAKYSNNLLQISGRNELMEEAEKNIIPDINNKLELDKNHELLDIGCGAGNLTILLMDEVKHITANDSEECLDLFKSRINENNNVSFRPGNFQDINISKHFDRILCYSVLHYLTNEKEVFDFITKALKLLVPGGKALFSDIPNSSKKERFLKGNYGKKIDQEYRSLLKKTHHSKETVNYAEKDEELVQFDDDLLIRILKETRGNGYHSYVLDQSTNLCLGYTREDILIVKPED
jgi:2-polyprenyl-3-methyl-5-hydroxy-6-metoxy-1,4-benzoquinol methylase